MLIVGFLGLTCVGLVAGRFVMVFLLWFIVPACCLVWFALGFGVVDSCWWGWVLGWWYLLILAFRAGCLFLVYVLIVGWHIGFWLWLVVLAVSLVFVIWLLVD